MKKLEKILGIAIFISLVLKIMLIPGGTILLSLSLTIIACIYYPLGFAFFNDIPLKGLFKKDSYSGKGALRIIGAIAVGTGLSVVCIGILFKLNRWPGAHINLVSGLVVTLVCFVVALIKYFKNKDFFYTGIFKRIAIIGGFGLLILFLSDFTIEKIQYRNHPEYIKAYKEYLDNPQSEELRKKLDIERHRATMSQEEFEMYMRYLDSQEEIK